MSEALAPPLTKAQQILAGARNAFLELGFEGASVDEIARRARVSKGTLYNYYPDKRALFAAFIEAECAEHARRIFEADSGHLDIDTVLRRTAHAYVRLLLSPFAQGIFRIAVAECQRFPEVGHSFYQAAPALGIRRLTEMLEAACRRGELAIDDVDLAANQFVMLCQSRVFHRKLFGIDETVDAAELDIVAEAAVDVFMAAYRPPPPNPALPVVNPTGKE